MKYARYSLCVTPAPDSDLARLGRHWLGWDMDQATELPSLKIEHLPVPVLALTEKIRRFGFHAPLTSPFRLANGHSPLALHHTSQALAAHLDALEFSGLYLSADAGHLSLRPVGDLSSIERLRYVVDQVFSEYRAPASRQDQSLGRRRSELSTEQMKAVIDQKPPPPEPNSQFEFVLTDKYSQTEANKLRQKLLPILTPNLPRPFRILSVSLCGEDTRGWFRVIQRYALAGASRVQTYGEQDAKPARPQVPHWS